MQGREQTGEDGEERERVPTVTDGTEDFQLRQEQKTWEIPCLILDERFGSFSYNICQV
jgi:hypothetical protein